MIEVILALLASQLGPWLVVAAAAIVAAGGLWLYGKRTGRQAERDAQARARQSAIDMARDVELGVAAGDPASNRKELSRWGR